ncbi:hypothetical protein MHK_001853 [Candidatus Magnetomorum sp. HK-1]|nr:hypothetical protein MHK_001853 [Candidatus Magnetomorum sp. HK-1]
MSEHNLSVFSPEPVPAQLVKLQKIKPGAWILSYHAHVKNNVK